MLKGYEAVYYFTHLYIQYGSGLMLAHLSEKKFRLFNEFSILPNKNSKNTIDYYENNKLYFIKKLAILLKQ